MKDEIVIASLLTNGSVKAAAKSLNVSESTIYRVMQKESFDKKYKNAKQRLLEEVCNKLTSTLTNSVDTVANIMNNESNSPQIRLNASQILFNACIRLTEQTEILKRIERLEKDVIENDV